MNNSMRFEFKVNLKHVNHRSQRCYMTRITKEPKMRQELILAYQLQELMEKDKMVTVRQISKWIGLTYRRILQIMDILYLASKIQEEILFSEEIAIYRLNEKKMRIITKEILWEKQLEVWKKLYSPS